MTASEIINRVIMQIAELPDRSSPEDWPEAMLVTDNELREILQEAFAAAESRIAQLDKILSLCMAEDVKQAFIRLHARAETAEAALSQAQQERDAAIEDALRERDEAEEWADKLASAIGNGDEGEHSNLNNPWETAINVLAAERKENESRLSALMEAIEPFAKSEFGHGYAEHKAAARVYEQVKEKI